MKIGQVAMQVERLPEAVAFYRDVLGFPLLFEVPNLAFFDIGGVRLMLSSAENARAGDEVVMYYRVDDLDAAFRNIIEKGAQSEKEPHLIAKMHDHDLWMAFVRDTDKRLVGLMSEVMRDVTREVRA